jgi:hypothetical protein
MATPRKRRVKTVADESYSKLDQHCIWLNEYHRALRKAGFTNDNALWIIATKDSYPDWVDGINVEDIRQHLDEEDE